MLFGLGMFLMLDIVVNNMAYKGDPNNVDYGSLHPFNDQSYFHKYCPINYSDRDSTLNVTPIKHVGLISSAGWEVL
jgi:alpha-amylase